MGAVGNFMIGWLSGFVGLGTAFQIVAGAVVGASVLALALPGDERRVPEGVPEAVSSSV